ncbi:MAG TPA: RNA polymerase sigma factor RpoD/SigA [Gemmata sp.]
MSTRANPSATFSTYLAEIDAAPLLSAAEERQLAARVLAGDSQARDRMVRANLRLVVYVARHYIGKGLPLDDLVSEGNMGLLRAVEGFEPSMNTRFSTYAAYWIKQSIRRALVNTAKPIRIPAYMNELLNKWRRATNRLHEELGRPPTHDEIAKRLGLSKKRFAIARQALRVVNAGAQPDAADARGLEEVSAGPPAGTPEAEIGDSEELARVLLLLDNMNAREATILRLRFGLSGEEPMTLKEIGNRFGLTRERVRQIESAALKQLGDGILA